MDCCNMIKGLDPSSLLALATLIVLIITAGIYGWIAWLTKETLDKTVEQAKWGLMPCVVFYYDQITYPHGYRLKNVAKGLALNIKFDKYYTNLIDPATSFIHIDLPQSTALEPGDVLDVKAGVYDHNSHQIGKKVGEILQSNKAKNIPGIIEYESILNQRYQTVMEFGGRHPKVKEIKEIENLNC